MGQASGKTRHVCKTAMQGKLRSSKAQRSAIARGFRASQLLRINQPVNRGLPPVRVQRRGGRCCLSLDGEPGGGEEQKGNHKINLKQVLAAAPKVQQHSNGRKGDDFGVFHKEWQQRSTARKASVRHEGIDRERDARWEQLLETQRVQELKARPRAVMMLRADGVADEVSYFVLLDFPTSSPDSDSVKLVSNLCQGLVTPRARLV